MIEYVLGSVVNKLNYFLTTKMGAEHPERTPYVILDNIGRLQHQPQNATHSYLHDTVVLTLVNIEVSPHFKPTAPDQPGYETKNSSVQVPDLFCLFSIPVEPYTRALEFLSLVINFFRDNPAILNSMESNDTSVPEYLPQKMIIEMVPLNFEQLQQIWSMLGCGQLPSVLYRIRT